MVAPTLRVVEGFDGAWILMDGADGRTHHVGTAYEAGAAVARSALSQVRSDLDRLGIDAWCVAYSVDPAAFIGHEDRHAR